MMTASSIRFSDTPANQWSSLLSSASPSQPIVSYVFWGAHESLKGVRDFYQSPRLNLEKYLNLVNEMGLKTKVTFGLTPGNETFPEWTQADQRTIVSEGAWESEAGGFDLKTLPNFYADDLTAGFCEYVEDLVSQISLYRQPDGPVVGIEFDPGPLRFLWNAGEIHEFSRWLAEHYGSIAVFNSLFQASFSGFEGIKGLQGIRALGDKRAWILCHDYKRFRSLYLTKLCDRIRSLPSISSQIDIFTIKGDAPAAKSSDMDFALIIDDVLFDWTPDGSALPLCPWGLMTSQGALAYRLAECLLYYAKDFGAEALPLTSETLSSNTQKVWLLICGKYIAKASLNRVIDFVDRGGALLCPFGLPQYDEKLCQIEWGTKKGSDRGGLRIVERGAGRIGIPTKTPSLSDNLWLDLIDMKEAIR